MNCNWWISPSNHTTPGSMRTMSLVKPRAAVTLDGKTPRQQWITLVCYKKKVWCHGICLQRVTAVRNLAPTLSFQGALPKIFWNTSNEADTHNWCVEKVVNPKGRINIEYMRQNQRLPQRSFTVFWTLVPTYQVISGINPGNNCYGLLYCILRNRAITQSVVNNMYCRVTRYSTSIARLHTCWRWWASIRQYAEWG